MSSKPWESFVKHRQLVFWKKLSTIEVFSRCQMVTRLHSCCSESMLKYSNRQNAQLGGSPPIHTMFIWETLKIKCFILYIFHKFLINFILYCMVDYFLYWAGSNIIMRENTDSRTFFYQFPSNALLQFIIFF